MSPGQGEQRGEAKAPDGTARIPLPDGSVDYLRLRPEAWQGGYRSVRRATGVERAEREMLAARVAREEGPVGPYRDTDKNAGVYWQGAHLRVGMQEARKAGADDLEAVERAIGAEPRVLQDAGSDALRAADRMSSVEEVLRQNHPDFDGRDRGERIALLVGAARHMDKVWWALEEFKELCQVGSQHGRPRKKAADAELDVRAAELKDSLGLSHREIGRMLGIPPSEHDQRHGGHSRVAGMIRRGRGHLIENLGEDGYRKNREDLRRWHELNARERIVQRMAEITAGLKDQPLEKTEAMKPDFERLLDEHLSEDDEPRT